MSMMSGLPALACQTRKTHQRVFRLPLTAEKTKVVAITNNRTNAHHEMVGQDVTSQTEACASAWAGIFRVPRLVPKNRSMNVCYIKPGRFLRVWVHWSIPLTAEFLCQFIC